MVAVSDYDLLYRELTDRVPVDSPAFAALDRLAASADRVTIRANPTVAELAEKELCATILNDVWNMWKRNRIFHQVAALKDAYESELAALVARCKQQEVAIAEIKDVLGAFYAFWAMNRKERHGPYPEWVNRGIEIVFPETLAVPAVENNV